MTFAESPTFLEVHPRRSCRRINVAIRTPPAGQLCDLEILVVMFHYRVRLGVLEGLAGQCLDYTAAGMGDVQSRSVKVDQG